MAPTDPIPGSSDIGMVPLHYLPGISMFRSMAAFHTIDFQLGKPYEKMSFRNRCVIAGSQGIQVLSVPILGGRGFRGSYDSVLIDHRQQWNVHHWRAIYSAYGRAPLFEYYADDLEGLFSSPPERLAEWNIRCLQWLYKCLGMPFPELKRSGSPEGHESRMIGPKTEDWPTPQNFQSESMGSIPRYHQVFQDKTGFLPNLSILDFILCAGPKTVRHWLSTYIIP